MAELVDNTAPAWKGRANEVLTRFNALPNNKKILFFTAIAAVLSIALALLVFNREPPYKVLFTGLADSDGGQVTAALQQMNVPYQIGDGGVISVPSERVYDTRLKLATQGLPKAGGVGFELMDKQKFGISQFAEQVNYQRSIEGELARTIEAVAVVDSARVHLAMPKQTVFVRDQQQPTASVMLTLRPGRILDGGQIAGIMHLVSSSVPNLPLRNVSIVDQDGNLLSTVPDQNNGSLDRRQLDYVRQIEADYTKRVETILEPIFGKGNARAQVTANVDFSESEQTSESFRPNSTPNPSATRSQQISETLGRDAALPSGVPGALTNQPPSPASAPLTLPPGAAPGTATLSGLPMGTASGSLSREITTNYEVDKTIQHTKSQKGVIKRLTAAVVVNYKMVPDNQGVLKATPLTEKEFGQINNLVKEAVGFNAERGDSVNVVNASFADAVPVLTVQDKVLDFASNNASDLLKYGLLLLAILYLLFGVVRPIMRDVVNPPPPPPVDDLETAASGGRLLAVAGEEREEGESEEDSDNPSPKELQRRVFEANMQNVRELVKSDPRMAAQIIKEWISSDE
ncbi:flagellar basal-body MS-ring/collar protein FliF [Vogesella indigofera]|uniref:flagellar basal-body MS-ring/collar protein FliF n=1 Tax=Vogesella indigofera TaxID=45465 RepID=UPI00234DAD9C|nr:flagellar basal-body MS-ring/collar protein FliF [Vogesella indigofera]MDC7704562.1 flagellar basal-body MS-ring/collar protein FliF [Vogesella indigofera]